MIHSLQQIASALKAARKNKRLTQRELSRKVRLPQSQISKIESGAVDLRLSSLIELSRALDLELTFVPRKLIPAVQSMTRSSKTSDAGALQSGAAKRTLEHLSTNAEKLQHALPNLSSLRSIQKTADALKRTALSTTAIDELNSNLQRTDKLLNDIQSHSEAAAKVLENLQSSEAMSKALESSQSFRKIFEEIQSSRKFAALENLQSSEVMRKALESSQSFKKTFESLYPAGFSRALENEVLDIDRHLNQIQNRSVDFRGTPLPLRVASAAPAYRLDEEDSDE